MNKKGFYRINSREFSQFEDLPTDILLQKDRNYLFDLSHLALLQVQGEKAAEFLQGQFTADIRLVTEEKFKPGLACNLKGRILLMADIIDCNGFLLLLEKDMLEKTMQMLMKTAVFSKVSIEAMRTSAVYGFYLQNPDDILPAPLQQALSDHQVIKDDGRCIYHLGNGLYHIISAEQDLDRLLAPFKENDQWKSGLAWHGLSLQKGYFSIYPESRGLFLPHRLDLQNTPYIDFDKGCYKGQEIIARTHYKAKLKHHLKYFNIHSNARLYSGQNIYEKEGNTSIGELIDYAPLGGDKFIIAVSILKDFIKNEVRLEHAEETLYLEAIST